MSHPAVIAIDGPAGSGKSSVSKEVARRLGFAYLDTGAAYRAVTWHVLTQHADPTRPEDVAAALSTCDVAFTTDPNAFSVRVGGTDVTTVIREAWVTEAVSAVSRVADVRTYLNRTFRVTAASCTLPGIVIEGRDITTVVAPEAAVRILLTADEATRMKRRGLELSTASTDDLSRQIRDRDVADAKVSEFMTAADGVITIDSTDLTFDQTVDAIVACALKAHIIT